MSEVRHHSGPSEERRRTEDTRRARLIDDIREIEAMTDIDLDLEIAATGKTIDDIAIDLMAHNEGVTDRGGTWKIAAEKRISAFRWRRKLCMGERARRTAERQRAHIEMAEATRAAKTERRARQAEQDKTDHASFVRHAKAMLPPETVRAIWRAVHQQPEKTP